VQIRHYYSVTATRFTQQQLTSSALFDHFNRPSRLESFASTDVLVLTPGCCIEQENYSPTS
jgi:hypothetical protein